MCECLEKGDSAARDAAEESALRSNEKNITLLANLCSLTRF